MKKIMLTLMSIVVLLTLGGCKLQTSENDEMPKTTEIENSEEDEMYTRITAEEAKKIMDEQTDYVILDVRTQEEFDEGHIENAILIPDYEITLNVEEILTDKDKLILVYCRSGRRSASAAKKMVAMGYTNVIDFGGIIDWPYDIV